jgi:TrmH family RNA methyltransferase
MPLVAGLDVAGARAALEQHRLDVYTAVPTGQRDLASVDLTRPCALIIGNEGGGVSERLRAGAIPLRIPTTGVESLNAAMAAGILLYEARRQRGG